jgi:tetratricopeptide (TPR) repeat protein
VGRSVLLAALFDHGALCLGQGGRLVFLCRQLVEEADHQLRRLAIRDLPERGNDGLGAGELERLALAGDAFAVTHLAGLYRDMGRYTKAEPLFRQSLKIKEAKLGKDHPDVAKSVENLAILYVDMGQYAKVEPLHRRSLKICEAKLGKDHPEVATSLSIINGTDESQEKFTPAKFLDFCWTSRGFLGKLLFPMPSDPGRVALSTPKLTPRGKESSISPIHFATNTKLTLYETAARSL